MDLFIKIATYTFAILTPIAIIVGLVFLFLRFGLTTIIQLIADKLDYVVDKITENIRGVFDFIITEFLRVCGFFLDRATEIAMLINVALIYQHPPQTEIGYITFCCYLAINTIVLLKKGNINIEKITDDLKEIAIKKVDGDKSIISAMREEEKKKENNINP